MGKLKTESFFRHILSQFGAGRTGAVTDMADRVGLSSSFVRQIAAGDKRPPENIRPLALVEIFRNAASAQRALAALQDEPLPGDPYTNDTVVVKADGFAALMLTYTILSALPDYRAHVIFKTPDVWWSHSRIKCEVPLYVAFGFMQLFGFQNTECIITSDDKSADELNEFEFNFDHGSGWVYALPTVRPSVDLMDIVRAESRKIFRAGTRASAAIPWGMDDAFLVIETRDFQSKWQAVAESAVADFQANSDQTSADSILRHVAIFKNDPDLFRYVSKLTVCINWILHGPVVFGDGK